MFNQVKTEKSCLTIPETAEVLGVGVKLVRSQIKAGVIPCLHLGRIYRVPVVQLNAFLAGELKRDARSELQRPICDRGQRW